MTLKIVASGGFDCLHIGHLQYLRLASQLGQLIVIVNTDEFLLRKKGYVFMPLHERMEIISELRCVDKVVACIDTDQSVCETLKMLHAQETIDVFAKGGDRKADEIPEANVCRELCIKIIDGLGEKINSSSKLVERFSQ